MTDQAQAAVAAAARRRTILVLAASLAFVLVVAGVIVSRAQLGKWNPLGPSERLEFGGRAYKLGGSWSEWIENHPTPQGWDISSMTRVPAESWPDRAVLLHAEDPPPGSPHTVICVQTRDGQYWQYVLLGGS